MNLRDRWPELAVLVPILGLCGLIARAEIALRSGDAFRISITGFDPRDLLHGHYLQYAYDFAWRGESSCGALTEGRPVALDQSCCVCLTRVGAEAAPAARQVSCDDVQACDGWLRAASLMPPARYFVPEQRATQLQDALRDRQAAVEVTCGPRGQPAFGDLYLDGRPWREWVGSY